MVERFRDELGDWRVCLLTPLGSRVHAPWGLAIEARMVERFGNGSQVMWTDDGIVLRLPEAVESVPVETFFFEPDEIAEAVVEVLPGTPLFASVFREAAARALLLPRRRPGMRTPLWQQRQRSADLLSAASAHPEFPILLEATRECLRDHFDVPALQELMAGVRSRRVRVATVDTEHASPFAQSLLLQWLAVSMYEGETPLAERRAAALALDRDLLRELLGSEDLRELLDPAALDEVELALQRLADGRRARGVDGVHDLLRELGPLRPDEIAARCEGDADAWMEALVADGRAIEIRVTGAPHLAAVEDAGRLRDALGVTLPVGVPAVFAEPAAPDARPLDDLVARFARTHGPFEARDVAARLGAGADRVRLSLETLESSGRVLHGEFRPGGRDREWCDPDVLRRIRRRSLAALRREVEPVDATAFARFLPAWQGADRPRGGVDALFEAVGRLQGSSIPASILETDVLPARVRGFRPPDLDGLVASGEVVWIGRGAIGANDGRVTLLFRDRAGALGPSTASEDRPAGPIHEAVRDQLRERGASFWPDLVQAAGTGDETVVLRALWDLVWAGEVTNDTLAPLRAFLRGIGRRPSRPGARPRPGRLRAAGPPAGAGSQKSVSTKSGHHPRHHRRNSSRFLLVRPTQALFEFDHRQVAIALHIEHTVDGVLQRDLGSFRVEPVERDVSRRESCMADMADLALGLEEANLAAFRCGPEECHDRLIELAGNCQGLVCFQRINYEHHRRRGAAKPAVGKAVDVIRSFQPSGPIVSQWLIGSRLHFNSVIAHEPDLEDGARGKGA